MSTARRRRSRPNSRFYMLIGTILLIVAVVAFLLLKTTSGRIENSTVSMEEAISGVIIRDESVITAETYGKITYDVSEGERITSGTKIAEVYKWGTYDSVLQDLLTLQQEIRNYQVHTILADVVNSELSAMDDSIKAKLDQIADVTQGKSSGDALLLETELKSLMDVRRDYLKNNLQPDTKLLSLYEQEQTLLDRLASWKTDVYSTVSGMVSFYFDGYETFLNKQTMPQLLPSDINSVLSGKAPAVITTSEKPLYRMVNTNLWYVAIVTKGDAAASFCQGETYNLVLDGNYDKPYSCIAESVTVKDGTGLTFLRIEDDVTPVIGTRTITATVMASFTGPTVASRAIVTVDGQTGIYIDNGSKTFVPVTVLYNNGDNAAIRAADGYSINIGDVYSGS